MTMTIPECSICGARPPGDVEAHERWRWMRDHVKTHRGASEPCGHVPARPDVDLTLCWKCGEVIIPDPGSHLWRQLSDAEWLVRLETVRELRNLFHSIDHAEYARVLDEKINTMHVSSIRLAESLLGRWIIVNGQREDLAWSGSRWVPHVHGVPTGEAQVSNFSSREEAAQYVKEQFPGAQEI